MATFNRTALSEQKHQYLTNPMYLLQRHLTLCYCVMEAKDKGTFYKVGTADSNP